jgi:secreted trypsin-like serine protease
LFFLCNAVCCITATLDHINARHLITGGAEASPSRYLYAMGLRYDSPQNPVLCGATLIAPKFALTAAHCISLKRTPGVTAASVGMNNQSDFTQGIQIQIQSATRHLNYDGVVLNDIGIIEFVTPISDPSIPIARLGIDIPPYGTPAMATGWGETGNVPTSAALNKDSQILKAVQLPLLAPGKCQATLGDPYNLVIDPKAVVCAGGATAGQGVCSHDSGSLVVQPENPILVGVTSFGDPNSCGVKPDGFARVANYRSFIDSIVTGHTWVSKLD